MLLLLLLCFSQRQLAIVVSFADSTQRLFIKSKNRF